MKNTVTNVSATKVKITVEVDKESWKAAQEKAFKKVSANVEVKGFRPGKAPRQLLEEKVNPSAVFDSAIDSMLNPAFSQALEETKIQPFLRPDVNVTKLSNDDLTLEFTVVLAPKCELGQYKGLELVKKAPSVTAKEVNESIEQRLENSANLVVKDDAAKIGDTVVFDFIGRIEQNGEMVAFDGGTADNYSLELGSNQFVPGFEEALVSVKAGDKKDVNITFPTHYVKELAGKAATFECKIHEVKEKVIPELNDESVAELGIKDGENEIKTVEELKAFEKKNLLAKKVAQGENEYYNNLVDKIVEASKIELDDDIVLTEAKSSLENMKKQIEQNGLTYEQYLDITGSSEDQLMFNFKEQAKKSLDTFVVLQQIAIEEKLQVTAKDIDEEATHLSEQYGIKKEDVIKYMQQDQNRWTSQILDKKLHDFLVVENKAISAKASAPKAEEKPAEVPEKKPAAKKEAAPSEKKAPAKKPAASAEKKAPAKKPAAKKAE